ncbi:MAG: hydrogenase maturation factor [Lachnospiraceae bacterium]|nr:hydrogenase maturation factor [Lachnospiraceae bacterium]
MKIGKVAESVLNRSVLKQIKLNQGMKMIDGASVGADCAIFEPFSGEKMCSSMQESLIRDKDDLYRLFHRVANNLACVGATKSVGVMVSLLLPEEMEEQDLQTYTKEMAIICKSLNMNIMGGQTNVSPDTKQMHVAVTGIAAIPDSSLCPHGKVLPGQDIVVSKWIALEGTALVAKVGRDRLKERYPLYLIDEGEAMKQQMSIVPEAAVAITSKVSGMHDVSEGGIFRALWEVAQRAGVGLNVDLKKIPIRQETVEICEFFQLNPYEMLSGGSLIMIAEDGEALVEALAQAQIPATVIGKITEGHDRVVTNEDETRFLDRPRTDEIYKMEELWK